MSEDTFPNLKHAKKMSFEQFSLPEIEIIICGLRGMNVVQYFEQKADLLDHYSSIETNQLSHLFPEPYLKNPLMLLLAMIFYRTAEISNQLYNDPHQFMNLKLQDSPVHDFFLMMYRHWKAKQSEC